MQHQDWKLNILCCSNFGLEDCIKCQKILNVLVSFKDILQSLVEMKGTGNENTVTVGSVVNGII